MSWVGRTDKRKRHPKTGSAIKKRWKSYVRDGRRKKVRTACYTRRKKKSLTCEEGSKLKERRGRGENRKGRNIGRWSEQEKGRKGD